MQLTLSQSTVRSFRPSDAASLMKHRRTDCVARYLNATPHPYTLQHAEEWIGIARGGQPETFFAIAVDDSVVGGIGVRRDASGFAVSAHCAEIGYWLGESYWGRGIATEAVAAVTEWAFTELNVVRLHAAVHAPNLASARVLEKAGYEFEGRLRARYFRDGEFMDGLQYAKVNLPQAATGS